MGEGSIDNHPLIVLAKRYHQLSMPIRHDENKTEEYEKAVLRGDEPRYPLSFSMSDDDSLNTVDTPAGNAEVLYLSNREDFEHAIRALAYRCEPVEIPKTMGASTIRGIINWEKINAYNGDINEFLKDKSNYLDTMIVLSDGPYSNVNAEIFGLSDSEWKKKSVTIREYHELTHFVSGKLFPQNKEAVRDEVIADMDGIIAAVGYYDDNMAKIFLGVEGDKYREGGRLQNYVDADKIDSESERAKELIEIFKRTYEENEKLDIFDLLYIIESNKIGT